VTRQRTVFSADQVSVGGVIRSCPIWRGYQIVLLGRQRQGKALGADPSPLNNYQVELILPTLLHPILLLS